MSLANLEDLREQWKKDKWAEEARRISGTSEYLIGQFVERMQDLDTRMSKMPVICFESISPLITNLRHSFTEEFYSLLSTEINSLITEKHLSGIDPSENIELEVIKIFSSNNVRTSILKPSELFIDAREYIWKKVLEKEELIVNGSANFIVKKGSRQASLLYAIVDLVCSDKEFVGKIFKAHVSRKDIVDHFASEYSLPALKYAKKGTRKETANKKFQNLTISAKGNLNKFLKDHADKKG